MNPETATVGELTRLVDEARLEDAWSLARAKLDALLQSRGTQRTATLEDAVSVCLIRVFEDEQSALRRADPDCPLRAWMRGVLANVRREMRRAQPARVDSTIVESAATADAHRANPRTRWGGVDLHRLTPKQRSAVTLRSRGHSWAAIAQALGISRRAARGRVDSAIRRLRKSRRENGEHWALACLRSGAPLPTRMPQEDARAMMRMHAEGASYREIGRRMRASPEAVRHRLRRLRNRFLGRIAVLSVRGERKGRNPDTKNE